MKIGFWKGLKFFSLFVTVCAAAYIVRDVVYTKEKTRITRDYKRGFREKVDFVPFTVESAMMYSYAAEVAETGSMPETDPLLEGMENEPVSERFTNGLEYFLGHGYRMKNRLAGAAPAPPSAFEDHPDFAAFARKQLRAWISLVSGLLFLWLLTMGLPWRWALFGGLIHALAPAAMARYTGQDLVRGDFDLVFIMLTFFTAALYLRAPGWKRLATLGAAAFAALVFWDMTQICFAIWGLWELLRVASGGGTSAKRTRLWIAIAVALLAASAFSTYHRVHWLILSPLALFVLPSIFAAHFLRRRLSGRGRVAATLAATAVFCVLWVLVSKLGPAAGNYGHFASLMKAKLLNLNVKPSNPAKIDFDARSVWVPAMHSADRMIFKAFFPMALNMTAALLLATLVVPTMRKSFKRWMGLIHFPLVMAAFYFLGFLFLVRYHVFAILFISMLLPVLMWIWSRNAGKLDGHSIATALLALFAGFTAFNAYSLAASTPVGIIKAAILPAVGIAAGVAAAWALAALAGLAARHPDASRAKGRRVKAFLGVAAAFVLAAELEGTLSFSRSYEKSYFAETAALIKWLRSEKVKGETFIAGFELSPMLKAYCGTKIALQPKFETKAARNAFREYSEIMFHGTENNLADFCEKHGAEYFVFDKGIASAINIYSPRYLADALGTLGPKTPAAMMSSSFGRGQLKRFYEMRPPGEMAVLSNRYIVFKVISAEDSVNAIAWALDAERAWRHGEKAIAARLAKSAVYADPLCPKAEIMYRKIYGGTPIVRLRGY